MYRIAILAAVAALAACSPGGPAPAPAEQDAPLTVPTRTTGGPGTPPPHVPTPSLVRLEVADAPEGAPATSFRLASTRDLYLTASFPAATGSHTMTVQVRTPAGDVYEREVVPLSNDLLGPAATLLPRGVHPLVVQRVAPWRDLRGSTRLALAGTAIQQQAVTGAWTFEVYLDDAAKPAASAQVVLQ